MDVWTNENYLRGWIRLEARESGFCNEDDGLGVVQQGAVEPLCQQPCHAARLSSEQL